MHQTELQDRFYESNPQDFGKGDVGRMERGDLALSPARRRALSEILEVPEAWWTAEDPFDQRALMVPMLEQVMRLLEPEERQVLERWLQQARLPSEAGTPGSRNIGESVSASARWVSATRCIASASR